jgi:hypothetical protein
MTMKTRIAAITLSLLGVVGAQFAIVTPAEAKSAKCFVTPVPGQPGVFIGTCTTKRP